MITLLIDGRSGAGKSELAAAIVATWPELQVLHMDDLYPGWDGLDAGSRELGRILSEPQPRWQRWDWHSGQLAEWHELDPLRPLLVEGVGSISRQTRALAIHAIWVQTDDATRRRRALERDGEMLAEHWDVWTAQEEAFMAREQPARLADSIVFGHNVQADAARWRRTLERSV